MNMWTKRFMQRRKAKLATVLAIIIGACLQVSVHAQTADGNNGINQATSTVKSYFDAGCNLMYAIGRSWDSSELLRYTRSGRMATLTRAVQRRHGLAAACF